MAVTEAGWDEAWGDVAAGTPVGPFDRWRDSIGARRVPLPEGISGYWTGQLRGEHAIVARIAAPLLTLRGSTRVVEGFFSMVRRAFPPEVCGSANYSTLRRRALLLPLPEFVPGILAAVYPGIA